MSEIFFIGALPGWVILLIALAILTLLVSQFRALRQRLGARKCWALTVLRGLVYASLVFFLLSPGLITKRVIKLREGPCSARHR